MEIDRPINAIIAGQSTFRSETFDCECWSYDHSIRFSFDPTEDQLQCQEIWVDTAFPTYRSLWQRLKLAAKYVLRSHVRDYTSGSWILKHEDYQRLRNFFLEFDMVVWKLKEKQKEGNNAAIKENSV